MPTESTKQSKNLPTAVEVTNPYTGEIINVASQEEAAKQLAIWDAEQYGADVGQGFQNQTRDDTRVPFILVMQPGSPEVQGEDARAKSGQLYNRVTEEVWTAKDGMPFVPAITEHKMVEWIPKNPDGTGGGFVGVHDIDSDLSKQVRATQPLGKYKHPGNGNDLVETYYVYGLVLKGFNPEDRSYESYYPAVMSFASTHITPYQNWMFKARSIMMVLPGTNRRINPALFAHVYVIRTEKKTKGANTWYVPLVSLAADNADNCRLRPSDDVYREAKALAEAVAQGLTKADESSLNRSDAAPEDKAPVAGSTDTADAPY